MKKFIAIIVSLVLILSCVPALAGSANNVTVMVDGRVLAFDVPAQIIDGRTMVPMRAIFEALGATVSWDADTYTASGTKDGVTVSIKIGDNKVVKDLPGGGPLEAIPVDVPAQIVGNRTLVPVRAISESFDCNVGWDGVNYVVTITTDGSSAETPVAPITPTTDVVSALKQYMVENGEYVSGNYMLYTALEREDGEAYLLVVYNTEENVLDMMVSTIVGNVESEVLMNINTNNLEEAFCSTTTEVEGHFLTVDAFGTVSKSNWNYENPNVVLTYYSIDLDGEDVTDTLPASNRDELLSASKTMFEANTNLGILLFEQFLMENGLPYSITDFGFAAY